MISIIDYGLGNLASIRNMLKRLSAKSEIITSAEEILQAKKLILPGVGAFDTAIEQIDSLNLRSAILEKTKRVPLLGICLGMQLLAQSSEEGKLDGLGLIDGKVERFSSKGNIKIPHMGWNRVKKLKDSQLLSNLPEDSKFYFVHSYHFKPRFSSDSILESTHGETFVAALQRDNIYGVQFHPEKSHKFGMIILKNFVEI